MAKNPGRNILLSIVTPAYNEELSLPGLYDRLKKAMDEMGVTWEWIVVDDHSKDRTYQVMQEIARKDKRVNAIRFSRNFGSHLAITCGLRHAKGKAAIFMAADLQDPPELLKHFLEKWKEGADVVWAVRANREREGLFSQSLAMLYYFIMRRFIGLTDMPPSGADFFLLDRKILEALEHFSRKNMSLISLISWLGFKQAFISYTRQKRTHGRSRWTFKKKLKLVADSITAISYAPIRLILWAGVLLFFAGLGLAVYALMEKRGYLYALLFTLSGFQTVMMGVMGEYLWRSLDEARPRPAYLIEETTMAPQSVDPNSTH